MSEQRTALCLISACDLFALVFICLVHCYFETGSFSCLLEALLVCSVWHVREHLACDCVLLQSLHRLQ